MYLDQFHSIPVVGSPWIVKANSMLTGDMKRPSCTLCTRVSSQCVFPTKRKRPERVSDKSPRSKKRPSRSLPEPLSDEIFGMTISSSQQTSYFINYAKSLLLFRPPDDVYECQTTRRERRKHQCEERCDIHTTGPTFPPAVSRA